MKVLGASVFGHDDAAFLVDSDARQITAVSLERVTRIKHDSNDITLIRDAYPELFRGLDSVCIGAEGSDRDTTQIGRGLYYGIKDKLLVYKIIKPKYIKDLLEFHRLSKWQRLARLGITGAIKHRANLFLGRAFRNDQNKEFFARYIARGFDVRPEAVRFFDHHLCHAASAYYFSHFADSEKVISITFDGYGDGFFSKVYLCQHGKMQFLGGSPAYAAAGATVAEKVISLGTLYGNFTEAMGLVRNSDEGKVEALAAYGKWDNDLFKELWKAIEIRNTYEILFTPSISKFYDLDFLRSEREKYGDKDFCAVIQELLNQFVVKYVKGVMEAQKAEKLALSGGVAANVIMNLHIFEQGNVKDVYVFPAMGDDGVAAGAAVLELVRAGEDVSWLKNQTMPYWGPPIGTEAEIQSALHEFRAEIVFEKKPDWQKEVAEKLFRNKVGALVQGKMEYGPRALGHRSIIASPMSNEIRERINASVKRRPWYQPFCPSILEEEREKLFAKSLPNKHMTFAFKMKAEYVAQLPSAAHVDGTARPQFVSQGDDSNYFSLLKEFKALSGFGVLINTSFNLHGRTIVRTPTDAIRDFLDCNLDFMVLDGYLIERRGH